MLLEVPRDHCYLNLLVVRTKVIVGIQQGLFGVNEKLFTQHILGPVTEYNLF